jgi:glutamate 5-kinase
VKAPFVVKLGSSLVADPRGRPRRRTLRAVAAELAAVDAPVCIVSSGAIALGLGKMGLQRRPRTLPKL